MGFHEFSSPYDWSRIASFKRTAKAAFGGMVDLSVGSPVDPVPDSVRKALGAASNDPNAYGYPVTAGTADLRSAIAEWFAAARNVDLTAIDADVVPTVGSKEGVALMASLLHLGAGDVVVQPKVSYPTYEIGTQLAGAEVLKVDDVADVESWKDVPGVKAVWVNSPCNPTGAVLAAEQMAAIVAAARGIGKLRTLTEAKVLGPFQFFPDRHRHFLPSVARRVRSGKRERAVFLFSDQPLDRPGRKVGHPLEEALRLLLRQQQIQLDIRAELRLADHAAECGDLEPDALIPAVGARQIDIRPDALDGAPCGVHGDLGSVSIGAPKAARAEQNAAEITRDNGGNID